MVAEPLNSTTRYIPPGTRQYYWVDTIADKSAPTRTELDAGIDLTSETASVEGFQVTSESVDTPDYNSRFTSKVPGMTSADDSSATLYMSQDSDDARSELERGDNGFFVIFPEGDDEGANGATMDVFPVRISAVSKQNAMEDPAQMQVQFTVTSEPEENIDVPSGS